MIIDMHCDTVSEIRHRRTGKGEECGLRENKLHIDARRLKENGYLLQCFALFVSLRGCGAIDGQGLLRPDNAWADLQKLYQIYQQEMARNTDLLQPVTDAGDLEQCRQTGKVGAMLTVEEGGVCGGRPERLEELYAMGVRMLTLTWNFPNELGHPNINALNHQLGYRTLFQADEEHGLTDMGRVFVRRMEELGMLVDVSHLSDRGFWDVAETGTRPFVASHSNARAVCGHVRNLTDEMIRGIAEKGGVMGINFFPDFLRDGNKEETRLKTGLDAVAAHIRHMIKAGGIDCVGLGSDFDGIPVYCELTDASKMPLLVEKLRAERFTEEEIEKIFYKNVLRVYKAIL